MLRWKKSIGRKETCGRRNTQSVMPRTAAGPWLSYKKFHLFKKSSNYRKMVLLLVSTFPKENNFSQIHKEKKIQVSLQLLPQAACIVEERAPPPRATCPRFLRPVLNLPESPTNQITRTSRVIKERKKTQRNLLAVSSAHHHAAPARHHLHRWAPIQRARPCPRA